MKPKLYIICYFDCNDEKDFEPFIAPDTMDYNEVGEAWRKEYNKNYDQELKPDDIVDVFGYDEINDYKITVTKK